MDSEITVAKLSIVDSTWQESPNNLSVSDHAGRGSLYLLATVEGPAEQRATLTRELIDTARRDYATGHGSIAFALAQAVRAANRFCCQMNASKPREHLCRAGITAAVMRGNELFLAQGGPGLTCRISAGLIQKWPQDSPWYAPGEVDSNSAKGGAVPLGTRRDYTPDLFHITLNTGDFLLFATCSLVHLLNDVELISTVAYRHPEEIVESLQDLAGTTDLSAIVVRLPGDPPMQPPPPESLVGAELLEEMEKEAALETAPVVEPSPEAPPPAPVQVRPPPARPAPTPKAKTPARQAIASRMRIDTSGLNAAVERLAIRLFPTLSRWLAFCLRVFLPEPAGRQSVLPISTIENQQRMWRLGALLFPILLLTAGGIGWFNYRKETIENQARQITLWLEQANAALEQGKNLSKTDKRAAQQAFQKAVTLTQQARNLNPNNAVARDAYYNAQDEYEKFNGIAVLFYLPKFATFADSKANPSRMVSHWPDIFVLDRGTQRVYRYVVNDAGSGATPAPSASDGTILKAGDTLGGRTVGELIDIVWLDSGRLLAVDRAGVFWQYEPLKGNWTPRPVNDASTWVRVGLASSYLNNIYLLDRSRNQILKYAPGNEGAWSSSVTYFAPEVKVDLSNAADMAIDGDVWVLRADGSIWRFTAGKLADFTPRDLDTPVGKSTSLAASQALVGLYVADAANQRIVQLDKVTGKFVRQFRPRGQDRDAFNALKTMAVDETNKKFFFISGNQAYLATIPQ